MWIFNGKEVNSHDDLHPDCTDFVYVITFDSGCSYIGKKCVRSIRRKPPLKGYKRNRRIMTNHKFDNYQGSFDGAKEMVPVQKNILFQCRSKKTATYLEVKTLMDTGAIFKTNYLNENISGVFFSNSLDGLIQDDEY